MSHTNFLGIPVEGDITQADRRVPQRPLAELEPLLRAVLDDPTIVSFGWTQYTPYFNDGEPCVFSAGEIWVRTDTDKVSSDEDSEDFNEDWKETLSVGYGHPSLGEFTWSYTGTYPTRERHENSYAGPDPERLRRCQELNQAIEGGAFDDVLLDAFGDHAEVLVQKTGIVVSCYEHD